MKIANASVELNSQRQALAKTTIHSREVAKVGVRVASLPQLAVRTQNQIVDQLSVSQQAQLMHTAPAESTYLEDADSMSNNDPDLFVIKRMVESITGESIRLSTDSINLTHASQSKASVPSEVNPVPQMGHATVTETRQIYTEAEATTVAAQGQVTTAAGQTLDFVVNFTMQREFVQQTATKFSAAPVKKVDPLVLNFDAQPVQLSAAKYSFDLNADGAAEHVSFVQGNSGFLALDHNADGQINNGSELFGALTGQGFAELAAYDSDHNHWIDENDPVYTQLKIWTKDAAGQDHLSSLADKNVGAIYLGQVASEFSLKDKQNQLLGQVRASGIYLQEDGSARTVQQVDLAI